ncbi:hypothetical protein F2P81_001761 [Scophthalmus maximus]|uniref:Large ribosomal subunit protein uL13m n=1 Tax=Scophthalmus maximus TaxID=52904 RepID=A0A6A4TT37_SCOMX|nr:hypothetical protein F2P81_001761 [Scophthalmus maximus]
MSSFSRSAQQWATFARSWFVIDAKMQPPGKIASMCSIRLQGKHKPIYHAISDCGDHVVVINTKEIAFSGNKWEQKVYSSHTGYPGGFKQVTAAQLHHKDPKAIMKLAVYGMLPKNLQRRTMMQRLHIFADDTSRLQDEMKSKLPDAGNTEDFHIIASLNATDSSNVFSHGCSAGGTTFTLVVESFLTGDTKKQQTARNNDWIQVSFQYDVSGHLARKRFPQ